MMLVHCGMMIALQRFLRIFHQRQGKLKATEKEKGEQKEGEKEREKSRKKKKKENKSMYDTL